MFLHIENSKDSEKGKDHVERIMHVLHALIEINPEPFKAKFDVVFELLLQEFFSNWMFYP